MKVLAPNTSATLTVHTLDSTGEEDTHDFTFSSSNDSVAAVSKSGPNTATVTAGPTQHTECVITISEGTFSTTELVQVNDTGIASVNLEWS